MIPGFIICILTFPGVIVHEMAHQVFCRIMRVAVFDVCYFRLGRPAGYVIHEHPRTIAQNLVISIGPFIINTVVGAAVAFPAVMSVMTFNSGGIFEYFLVWLGVSIAMHAFPSTGDAKSIWTNLNREKASIWIKALVSPVVLLIYVGAVGSVFWLDLFYGVGVCLFAPTMLAKLFA